MIIFKAKNKMLLKLENLTVDFTISDEMLEGFDSPEYFTSCFKSTTDYMVIQWRKC